MRWNEETFARIVALANEAALQPDRWDTLVSTISLALGANGGAVFTPELDPAGLNLCATAGTGTTSIPEFATHWATEDPWFQAVNRSGRVWRGGEIHLADELVPAPEVLRTAYYNEFIKHHGIENVISLKVIGDHDPAAPATHLSFFQTRRAESLFGEQQRQALNVLWPHLQRAIHTYWTLRKARDFDRIAEGALDALPQPTWVLREELTIEHANRCARELMVSAPWLRAGARRLMRIGDLDSGTLHQAVRAADAGGGRLLVAALPMAGRLRRAVLRIAPLAGAAPYATAWPLAHALLTIELPPPDDVTTLWQARLAKHYGLTPAETRVLERLCTGLSPRDVADEMRVTYATVRTHLRALFDKTGCHKQSDLMRLMQP
ncbi:helix-turn-helix transcriptional regulator [Methylibium sp.]|uniref:helix-turn-helix transcriptional regulator n=1 Tax=Methylibium sp. TaxID=2067992 RepID=UPI003D0B49E5